MTFVKGGPCYKYNPVWTPELDEQLLNMIGIRTYAGMAKALGKSVDAVRKRAQRLGYKPDQGMTTLRALARDTGYDRHQFRRAAKALGQVWARATAHRRKLLITGDQALELIDYLANESKAKR